MIGNVSFTRNYSLGFHRIWSTSNKLNAPALVGLEFRNGLSYPIYNGIVVYEEYFWRGVEEKRKNATQAISR